MNKSLVTLIFMLLFAHLGLTQFTHLYTFDSTIEPWQLTQTAHFGDKVHLKIPNNNSSILETDGTKSKLLNTSSSYQKYLQISPDTCYRISKNNLNIIIELFAATLDQPTTYTIPNFDYYEVKTNKNLIVFKGEDRFAFFNIKEGTYVIKQYPELTSHSFWLLNQNNIIISPDTSTIFKISLDDFNMSNIVSTGSPIRKSLIAYSDSLFLYIENDTLYSSNMVSSTYLKAMPYFQNLSSQSVLNNNSVYFTYVADDFKTPVFKSDGTKEGTILLTSSTVSPFIDQIDLFTLKGKIFYKLNDTLWTSDGTISGTHTMFDYSVYRPYIQFGQLGPTNGYYFYFAVDSTQHYQPIIFDGISDTKIYSENSSEAHLLRPYPASELIGKNNVYLPLIDIRYGKELHRFNYVTKKVSMVADFTPHANWSNISTVAETNHRILIYVTQGGKTHLMSFLDSLPNITPSPIELNFDWSENIHTREKIKKEHGVVDKEGNYYISIHTPAKKVMRLINNKKKLAQSSTKKLIKFSKTGVFQWSVELPNSKKHPAKLAISSQNELLTAMMLTNNVQINGQDFILEDGNLLLISFNSEGVLLHSKQFNIGKNGQIDDIVINKDDEVFISGKYLGKQAQFDQHSIQSERNKATFLIKLTLKGKTVWANSYHLPYIWPIDNESSPIAIGDRLVYLMQRIPNEQRLAECKGKKHRFRITAVQQSTGKTIWVKEIVSKDFSYPIDLASSYNDQLTVIGSYMDEIKFDTKTLYSDSCNQTNFFQVNFDAHGQELKAEKLEQDIQFLSQSIYDKKGNFYIVGSTIDSSYFGTIQNLDSTDWSGFNFTHQRITISKYNPLGSLINKTYIHQNSSLYNMEGYYENLRPSISFSDKNKVILSCKPYAMIDTFNVLYSPNFLGSIFLLQFEMDDLSPLTLDNKILLSDITLSPNPVNDYLNIMSTDLDFTETSVSIYTMDGKQWKLPTVKNNGHVKINTSTLPQGIYAVAIRLGEKVLAHKFIKF